MEYPHELSLATLICFTGTIEGTLVAMVAERGRSACRLIGWDWKLLAVVFSMLKRMFGRGSGSGSGSGSGKGSGGGSGSRSGGGSGGDSGGGSRDRARHSVSGSGSRVTAFSPMMTVFTALTRLFFAGENLFLGGLIGALLVFLGLFSVLSINEVPRSANEGDQDTISCTVNVDPEIFTVVRQDC